MKHLFRNTLVTLISIFICSSVFAQPYGWVALTSGTSNNLYGVSFTSPNTGTAVGLSGTVLRTTNGGTNWVPQTTPGPLAHLFDVYFYNDNTGWIVGDLGKIVKTTNGGTTWVLETSNTSYQLQSLAYVDANTLYAAGWYGTILKTTNGGSSWVVQNTGTIRNLNGIYFVNANLGFAVGLLGKLMKTTNGGTQWDSISIGTNYALEHIMFSTPTDGNIVGENGIVYKTTNAGTSWTTTNLGSGVWLNDVNAAKQNLNLVTLLGQTGMIRRTTNMGLNWWPQVSNTGFWLKQVSFSDTNNALAVGDNGTIIKTTTGGWLPPPAPGLSAPGNNSTCVSLTPTFTWNNVTAPIASSQIMIATNNTFTNVAYNIGHLPNTQSGTGTSSYVLPPGILQFNTVYYWRIKDSNQVATGPWSGTWSFRTTNATPAPPGLQLPLNNATGVSLNAVLLWDSVANATTYRVRVATDAAFTAVVLDSSNIVSHTVTVPNGRLTNNRLYYWRITSSNPCVTSTNSVTWSFTTINVTGISSNGSVTPKEFKLYDNYPNPFNPNTNIKFDLPGATSVDIIIYNAAGQQAASVVNQKLEAGSYSYTWDASNYPSGVYFYTIKTDKYYSARKMVLIK